MKKMYMKPVLEVELYTLDQNIAANCGNVVTLGPNYLDWPASNACDEFKGDDEILSIGGGSLGILSTGTSFYNGANGPACDCYYSSGGEGYFTS